MKTRVIYRFTNKDKKMQRNFSEQFNADKANFIFIDNI